MKWKSQLETMKNKLSRPEIIAILLKSREDPVLVEEINALFQNTDMGAVTYRISTYIYMIKNAGGKIKVYKDGRKVLAYHLLNPEDFDDNGRYIGTSITRTKTQLKNRSKSQSQGWANT